jgi:hypothetical protein
VNHNYHGGETCWPQASLRHTQRKAGKIEENSHKSNTAGGYINKKRKEEGKSMPQEQAS